jgi:hypothetical protein
MLTDEAAAPVVSVFARQKEPQNESVISGTGKSVHSSAFSNALLLLPSSQVRMPVLRTNVHT